MKRFQWSCLLCGREEPDLHRLRCRDCDGALDAVYDLTRVEIRDGVSPLHRFGDLLPLREPENASWFGEGGTPCVHAEALGRRLGSDALFLKVEGENPSRSTKDRMATVGLARMVELGVTETVVSSTGNSSTAYALAAQLLDAVDVHVFVGEAFVSRLAYPDHPRVRTWVVPGGFGAAEAAAVEFARDRGIQAEGGFFNPARRDGLKLAYLEAFEQMPVAPRFVFQAVSSGMGLVGGHKGAHEFHKLGLLPRIPSFVAVQQSECAPMTSAWAAGRAHIVESDIVRDPSGIAEAILRGNPTASYPYIARLCQESGGQVVAVPAEEIRAMQRALLDDEGLSVCAASAASLAGCAQMLRDGQISSGEAVLVNLTGADRPEWTRQRTVSSYAVSR
ncbi:pyridoxal-phosphate dependent enzyme [Lentzea tibetensis]|uniref:Pyridoxal-phosphate dependent enzyme n=1 Tax=Lentzea tibetensis TaxID=2591470 RepID=A0A563EXS4_9PSEU|nr:pyridoxal-phosphate dependent enzyme [Lentzea tibetensis]TWP52515.1 pyridoxal-phosphate dependent enzyme [Lentzea tibetensis]